MRECVYLCSQCRNVFELPAYGTPCQEEEVKCPSCGSIYVEELSSCTPAGFTEGSSMWEYECQRCGNVFKLPVPGSPAQERERKCPACGGRIRRVTVIGGGPLYRS